MTVYHCHHDSHCRAHGTWCKLIRVVRSPGCYHFLLYQTRGRHIPRLPCTEKGERNKPVHDEKKCPLVHARGSQ